MNTAELKLELNEKQQELELEEQWLFFAFNDWHGSMLKQEEVKAANENIARLRKEIKAIKVQL